MSIPDISAREQKVVDYSERVDSYKKKYSEEKLKDKSRLMTFCLSPAKTEGAGLAQEGIKLSDDLNMFANSQTGDCQTAATSAENDIDSNVRSLTNLLNKCSQRF